MVVLSFLRKRSGEIQWSTYTEEDVSVLPSPVRKVLPWKEARAD